MYKVSTRQAIVEKGRPLCIVIIWCGAAGAGVAECSATFEYNSHEYHQKMYFLPKKETRVEHAHTGGKKIRAYTSYDVEERCQIRENSRIRSPPPTGQTSMQISTGSRNALLRDQNTDFIVYKKL